MILFQNQAKQRGEMLWPGIRNLLAMMMMAATVQ